MDYMLLEIEGDQWSFFHTWSVQCVVTMGLCMNLRRDVG